MRTETTPELRQDICDAMERARSLDDFEVTLDMEVVGPLVRDAHILARMIDQVRELADRIESDAEPVLEDTECIVDELRAILDT